jgi:putative endopeptidase
LQIVDNAAPYLLKAFADAYFDMHDRTLAGQKEQKVRWKRGVLTVSGGDFAVGDRFGTFGTLGFDGWRVFNSKKKLAPHLARHLEVLCKGRFSLPIFL